MSRDDDDLEGRKLEKLSERVKSDAEESRRRAEETQRNIDFIIRQQAHFSANLDRIAEKVDGLADAQQRAEVRWERTEEGIRSLLAIAEIHEREITAIHEAGRATDERLNALIGMVERIIAERRDGKQES